MCAKLRKEGQRQGSEESCGQVYHFQLLGTSTSRLTDDHLPGGRASG